MRVDRAELRGLVDVELTAEWEDTDPEHHYSDPEDAESVRERMRGGSAWAWACVTVKVELYGLSSESSLGGCSYESEADFKQSGYYDDMVDAGVEELAQDIERIVNTHGVIAHDPIPCLWCAAKLWRSGRKRVPMAGKEADAMTRVGIVEGNQIIRWALEAAIGGEPGLNVTWTAASVAEAIDQAGASAPDVIVVGYDVPDREADAPALPGAVQLSMRAGPLEPKALVDAIRAEAAGERATVDSRGAAGVLTAREQQVMCLLAQGRTNREIAEGLEISVKTVDTHRGHVLKKLDLRNNAELARFAVAHGYTGL